jgi:hypothetical protein
MFDDFELYQRIEGIASQFKVFECVECAEAIKQFLVERGIHGIHIKLSTASTEEPFCNIYHEQLRRNISVNGRHEAILVTIGNEELIFDNLHPKGILFRSEWISRFYFPGKDIGQDLQY